MRSTKSFCLLFILQLGFFLNTSFTQGASSAVEPSELIGLWLVENVRMGENQMTPNARWMRFNKDLSQESGNGWFQHSYGTWSLDQTTGLLTVVNTNGLIDPSGPFKVSPEGSTMQWTRIEEGEEVSVSLSRIDKLPATYGDQILGLWQLEEVVGDGDYFKASDESMGYIFFRWDKRITIGSPNGRIQGVYNVHGHKPEVEIIPYGEDYDRQFWTIEYKDGAITLHLLNSDTPVIRSFVRIHEFPG